MIIRTNILSINSHRNLQNVNTRQAVASKRLSSGFRINSAADDAAGIAISEGMRAQIRGLNRAEHNAQDGINLIRVAEGALQTIHTLMHRLRELAVQSANDTYNPTQRLMIDLEFQQLRTEIDSIVSNTSFNGIHPLRGIGMDLPTNVIIGVTGVDSRQIFVSANECPPLTLPTVPIPVPDVPDAPNLTPVLPTAPTAPSPVPPGTGTEILITLDNLDEFLEDMPLIVDGNLNIGNGNFVFEYDAFAELMDSHGVTSISLLEPVRVTVDGPIDIVNPNSLVVAGTGGFLVQGSITGNGPVTIGGDVIAQVAGNVGNPVTNNGHLDIIGNAGGNVNNSGNLRIGGTASNITNSGHLDVAGNVTGTLTNNSYGVAILRSNANNISNAGQLQVTGNVTGNVTSNTGTLLIHGTAVNISNSGNLDVVGDVTGTLTNNSYGVAILRSNANVVNNAGHLQVNNNVTGNFTNSGVLHIGGNATGPANTNSGHFTIMGNITGHLTNTADGIALLNGNAGTVTNSGHIRVVGTITNISNNAANAVAVLENAANTSIFNAGHMQIFQANWNSATNTGTTVTDNNSTGRLLVSTGTGVRVNNNSGTFQSLINNTSIGQNSGFALIDGNNAHVTTNTATGQLRINGSDATITTNSGHAHIYGHDAHVTTNTATGQLFIEGDSARIITNNGHAHIDGDWSLVDVNNNEFLLRGHYGTIGVNNTTGTALTNGRENTIITNNGDANMNGPNATVITNTTTGRVRFDVSQGATVDHNFGRVEVSEGSTLTNLGINHETGMILVESGGSITGGNPAFNDGTIHVATTASINIQTNGPNGTIISHGDTEMNINSGYLQVGIWEGDAVTPPEGSASGSARVTTNDSGIIRNFSANLIVEVNISGPFLGEVGGGILGGCQCSPEITVTQQLTGGRIENYGTMLNADTVENRPGTNPITEQDLLPAQVRHHARRVNASGITADGAGQQIITFFANGFNNPAGAPQQITGVWTNPPIGESDRRLTFEGPNYFPENFVGNLNSWLVFNAGPHFEIPGTQYDILYEPPDIARPSIDVAGSTGTTNRYLVFQIHRPFMLQVGANSGDSMELRFRGVHTQFLGSQAECLFNLSLSNVRDRLSSMCALGVIDAATTEISAYRAELGAQQNRLEFTIKNLDIAAENLSAAESRIRDADMAKEMMRLTQANVLQEAATAMLAQANQNPNTVLQLLQT